jgi:hypothetical protein
MNNMNFGDPFLQFGPGLASLWGGEQVGLNFDSQRINQQKGLEDILTSQQTRQQSAELQPFKVDEARIKNQKAKDEVTAANLQQFTDAVYQDVLAQGNIQGPPDTVGNAARWSGQAKAMGLDPEDYRVKVILGTAAQGPQGLAKVREALYRMSSKGLEKTDDANRQAATDAAATSRNTADNVSRERQVGMQTAAQIEAARIQAESRQAIAALKGQAQQKLAGIEQRLVQLTSIINDPNSPPEQKQQAQQEAATLVQAKQAIQTAVVSEKHEQLMGLLSSLNQGGGMPTQSQGQRPPAATMPPQFSGTQAANPATTAPSTVPQARQMSPQDQQALQWARSNPQDPRSRAILQKLGVQ